MATQHKIGDLRVWWIPQVGQCRSFYAPVADIEQAKLLLKVLADYDIFQYNNRIKPDFANAGGLSEFVEDAGEEYPDWTDWTNEDGETIDEVMRAESE